MLTSLALIFLCGMCLGSLLQRLHLPSLLGMLITGIMLGPSVLNVLSGSLLSISADLRQLALIIILSRAGLSLDMNDLKRIGRPALLMCFVPACFEIGGMLLLAPRLLGVSLLDAAIMGAVVAAVSPAVVVPKMLRLMEEGYGTQLGIPQLIMAGASVDDVFVIVVFTAFTGLAMGDLFTPSRVLMIPVSIFTGVIVGSLVGVLLLVLFKKWPMRDSAKVIILLSLSALLVAGERVIQDWLPFSGLLAVMAVGVVIQGRKPVLADRLASKFSKLWVAAEVWLFVLVGATVDIRYAVAAGVGTIVLILAALAFRMAGVFLCLARTKLSLKERLFCMIAYTPKATVQAAIGSLPLAMGLSCGPIVLTVAVLSILITAPLGAFGIDCTYTRLLSRTGGTVTDMKRSGEDAGAVDRRGGFA